MCPSEQPPSFVYFPTTPWTGILTEIQKGDSQAATAALNEFCLRYRPAICRFFHRHGCNEEQSDDLSQEFFRSRILKCWDQRQGLLFVAERRGEKKFRKFLCHALWWFLKDERKRQRNRRSGGGAFHLPLEEAAAASELTDEEAFTRFGRDFDREFAVEIIQRAAERTRFPKCHLAVLRREMPQEEAARRLGISVNAFKQAHLRFRRALRLDLKREVADLGASDEKEVRAELSYLLSLFCEGIG